MKYSRLETKDDTGNSNISYDKAYSRWRKWMELGSRTGCHQRADRSFFLKGYQLPVCARCTGVFMGYLTAIPGFFIFGFSRLISLTGAVVLFTDWLLQAKGLKESTNKRRLITGICGGYGLMSIQLIILKKIITNLIHKQ